jgi:2-dehydropantoate 2-reductase
LDLGRYPHGSDRVSHSVSRDLAAATFNSLVVDDIRRWKHRKLLTNLGNAVEAVCGPGARSSPQAATLVATLVAEGEAALVAAGLDAATTAEDRARRGDLLRLGAIAGRTRQGGSSWQSVHRGTGNIETDYLNGEIVLLGRIHGVPTPANELIQSLARGFVASGRAPGSVSAASIIDQLERHTRSADLPVE